MRVSLAPRHRPPAPQGIPLLHGRGARVLLGATRGAPPAMPIVPAADTLFGPRGACLVAPPGPLIVSDTGHHRLLVWQRAPRRDYEPADLVIGQPGFHAEGRNAKGPVGAATCNMPAGIAVEDGMLAVADAWNHRVLMWHGLPRRSNQPADLVLGQADFVSAEANRGKPAPDAATLNWCYGVAIHDGRLIVADTGNRRVLLWNRIPQRNGAPADLVLGQADFNTRDENGMRWPYAACIAKEGMFVADAGGGRVMAWRNVPQRNGALCDFAIGEAINVDRPYGLAVLGRHLVVADAANSRLCGFDMEQFETRPDAVRLAGQCSVEDWGDNRWGSVARDSLCWPYGVSGCANTLAIADSGNNRVLLWEAA